MNAVKLTGTPFGTPGSFNNSGNTFNKVYDGSTATFFDAPGPNGNFAGIDQGSASVTGVAVTPATATVNGAQTQQFSATVNGTGSPAQTVTWTASAGTISSGGLFTAPAATASAQTITVTATSTINNTKSGTATVTVPATGGAGQIRFFPRPGSPAQMQGGKFQGSADGVTYTDLYTIPAVPTDGQWTTAVLSVNPRTYRYLRYLGPNNSYGNVAEVEFYTGTGTGAVKLTGTPFGTAGSFNNAGNTFNKVFDGNTTTFFDGPGPNGNFAGIDQGS